jgi:transposase
MSRQRRTSRKAKGAPRKIKPLEELKIVHPHAAGLDIGAEEIWASVPVASTAEPVRVFGTFTVDLHALADWLVACGVDTVAMESTGVYWIPIFEILEARGLKVFLVNSWHLRHVPGRKSDVLDCQWIQQLHSLGLLRGSFRPDAEMCALRSLLRHRAMLIEHRSPHILHIQKALLQMNLQLPVVISDVMGETGQLIIRAIVAGERDPLKLAHLRFPGCKSSEDEIAKALTGTWQDDHLFELKQALHLVDCYTHTLADCDAELARRFAAVKPRWDAPADLPELPKAKAGSRSKNAPAYNARAELFRITGVDLVAIKGISASLAQTILSEVGTDMSRFPTEKHFCSWLGLVPHHEISGGKVLRNHTLKTDNRAGQAFRQAAACVIRSDSVFGAFYRRKKAQLGPMQALVATAHKIARTVYHLLKFKTPYQEIGANAYEQKYQERELAHLRKKAAKLGYTLAATAP